VVVFIGVIFGAVAASSFLVKPWIVDGLVHEFAFVAYFLLPKTLSTQFMKLPTKRTFEKMTVSDEESSMICVAGNEEYRAFMEELTAKNVDKYVDLPMIAVMGDTSSGKSSLLSMISTVELPSSEKLTTRCPIMLQMRKGPRREATVTVQWKGDKTGYFSPKKVDETNWDEIDKYISSAQECIINSSGKEVARDIVNVNMKGPHCEDLSLIDLPGIVRSTGKGESESLTQDIQSLLEDYLQNPRCVILAVLPANVDFHNSGIMASARKVDPGTRRTLPVLTKADLIDKGAEGSVKELLLGNKTEKFEMGFHIVKGRSQKDLNEGTSIVDALKDEEQFFNNTQPWRSVDEKSLLGTHCLRKKLGRLLMKLVQESFPSIVKDMKVRKEQAAEALRVLGTVPTSLAAKRSLFMDMKEEFTHQIKPIILGNALDKSGFTGSAAKAETCQSKFHSECTSLKKDIEASKFSNISNIDVGVDVIALIDGTEHHGTVCYVSGGNIYLPNQVEEKGVDDQESTFNSDVGVPWESTSGKIYIKRIDDTFDELSPIAKERVRPDPTWIQELIESRRSATLPIFANADLFQEIVRDLIDKEWYDPCMRLVEKTSNILREAAAQKIHSSTKLKPFPNLMNSLLLRVNDEVDALEKTTAEEVDKIVRRDELPYTQNHYLFENLAKLRSERIRSELKLLVGASESRVSLSSEQVHRMIQVVFDRNQRMSVGEHMAEEMLHSLDAYGKVAMKRIIDNVPMICLDILKNFPDKFSRSLSETGDNEIERLLQVSESEREKFVRLEEEVEILSEGLKALRAFY